MSTRKLFALLTALTLLVAACSTGPSAEQLPDIEGVEQLATEFNSQQGTPRLLLLLSPT